ncbi:hypothetical protein WR25_13807 [Diploscapter pachys]|uniref:Potassium channel domain-containing protein n=1 Tax=Diploscapter pachys TaxID=2018661 RepID=A0A2A2J2I6_9BILA|nr:hypothetical protein WR25_13807 [Diploscapter pachys]
MSDCEKDEDDKTFIQKLKLLESTNDRDFDPEEAVDEYIEKMFILFENPHYAHVFESHFTNYSTERDMWTFGSAILFTTTTVIPVGFGHVWPESPTGKILLIVYGIIGIPLILVTMADTGKFISQFIIDIFNDSNTIPTIIFLGVLFLYPIFYGLYFHYNGDIPFTDAIYFSLTSIFTIGFGDTFPQISVGHLIVFLVIGIILVTITIDFVAAELINNVHYMGRGVGKAKQLAGKMIQVAQSISVNKGILGLSAGMAQLQALAKAGLIGKLDKEVIESGRILSAYSPALDDVLFVDTASARTSKHNSPRNSQTGRHLFVS